MGPRTGVQAGSKGALTRLVRKCPAAELKRTSATAAGRVWAPAFAGEQPLRAFAPSREISLSYSPRFVPYAARCSPAPPSRDFHALTAIARQDSDTSDNPPNSRRGGRNVSDSSFAADRTSVLVNAKIGEDWRCRSPANAGAQEPARASSTRRSGRGTDEREVGSFCCPVLPEPLESPSVARRGPTAL
jgi:hypothetical protein